MEKNSFYEIGKTKYLTLIGHVQSGKTAEEINYCYNSVFYHKSPVIFIVRNIRADQLQLRYRFLSTNIKVSILSFTSIDESIKILQNHGILILLCNKFQLLKLKEILKIYQGIYNLCIDEVDFSIKSKENTSTVDQLLYEIKESASHILGATATPIALFSNEKLLSKIKKINPGKCYHGIDTLTVNYVQPNITKNVYSDIVSIRKIYNSLLEKEHAVLLHTVYKKKESQENLMLLITKYFPQFTVILYNGDGIKVKSNRIHEALAKEKTLNNHKMVIKYHYYDNIHYFENYTISEVLQLLKNQSHISIIAGNLASRGISFVSTDYRLHLTDQYLVPGKTTHGEYLLQSLRILGCYSNEVQLRLWCDEKTWKSLLEQNKIINDIVSGIHDSREYIVKLKEIIIKKPAIPLTRPKLNIKIIKNKLFLIK